MIGYSVKVISCRYPLRFAIHHCIFFQIQALQWEIDVLINFFLLTYLCVSKVEEACFPIISALFRLKSFQLNHQDLGDFVQFKLLLNISVFFTFSTIPLIVTRKSFILAKIFNTFIQTHTTRIIGFLAAFDIIGLDTSKFRLIMQVYTNIKEHFPRV